MHFYRQPTETCSPGDAPIIGPNSKFRRYFYATAHAGEKRMSIIDALRYLPNIYPELLKFMTTLPGLLSYIAGKHTLSDLRNSIKLLFVL
jgi:hypothetical protein